MILGDTFVYLSRATSPHLWIVTSDPARSAEYVIFNFTSQRPGCDNTCMVEADEHPWFTVTSVVAYQHGTMFSDIALAAMRKVNQFSAKAPASPELLHKVQAGALISDFVSAERKALIQACHV